MDENFQETLTLDGKSITREELKKKIEESQKTKKFIIREDEKIPGKYITKFLLHG
jgi:biopolymer transport protein ExbD